MNDIERAIESMKNIKEYWSYKPTEVRAAELAISALEKQLNNSWIPVSERLPEKEDIYQVTVKYENFAGVYVIVRTATYEDEKWSIHGSQSMISNKTVIAWQLPEPYEEGK